MYICHDICLRMKKIVFFLLFTLTLWAQPARVVDFKTIHAALSINPVKRNVTGQAEYTFELFESTDTLRIDAQKMVFTHLKLNGASVPFKENKKQLLLFEGLRVGNNVLSFDYEAFPTQAMYFVNWDFNQKIDTPEEVQGQIWTQGQGKNTSHWLPCIDDVNDKTLFRLDVAFHKSFEVISNGVLVEKQAQGDDIIWKYRMNEPMSSYLVMLAIGHFQKKTEKSASGIPLEMYYEAHDADKVEPTYRYSKKIFDYLEKTIGVGYPWKVYRQIPVRDFLYAGMENTSSTLFSRDFVVDSMAYNDRNYLNVNAHELAHQWFGDLVTAQSGKDHWLQEGFATYYALLAERSVFGDDYFYNKLYKTSRQLIEAAKTDTIPLLNPKASSLSFYQKGAWALHVLREQIGAKKFDLAVKNYLKKYAFQNVTTDDFLAEVKKVSLFEVAAFQKLWLESAQFPAAQADALLLKNAFVKQYYEVRDHRLDLVQNRQQILDIFKSKAYFPIKELLVYQATEKPFAEKEFLLQVALKTGDIKVRQAVANSLEEIPESFRIHYETLLDDASYETREAALYFLWKNFPNERVKYIEKSKKWIGFQDQNLRLMHLYLAYLTTDKAEEKSKNYFELLQFTGTNYDSGIQELALRKLISLELFTEDVLKSLAYGTGNHRWQFVRFCKENIRKLLKDDQYRKMFTELEPQLPIREKTQLQRLLNEKEIK